MKKTFTSFLLKCVLLFVLLVAADFCIGWAFDDIRNKAFEKNPTHVSLKTLFTAEKVDGDVVIIGASTASHHYVSKMIEDSLGMSCYNCGEDGHFFLYQNCLVNVLLDRYFPKALVWDIGGGSLKDSDRDVLNGLYPYYDNEYCKDVINSTSWKKKYLMQSEMFRNNSVLVDLLKPFVTKPELDNKGYDPLPISGYLFPTESKDDTISGIDNARVELFENTLQNINDHGVELYVSISPRYSDGKLRNTIQYKKMLDLADEYGATIIDYYHDARFADSTLFKDAPHMNDNGARLFTGLVIEEMVNNR